MAGAHVLETPVAHAEPPRDCMAKAGCTRMATYHVVVTEGSHRFYKQLCLVHLVGLRADASAGRLVWPKPAAPAAVGQILPGAAAPVVPAAPATPPPLIPKPERPRIVFPLPEVPLFVRCKSCGANMVWINHPKTGSLMPINGDGDRRGEAHFATCPNANAHRKNPR